MNFVIMTSTENCGVRLMKNSVISLYYMMATKALIQIVVTPS